MTTKNAAEVLAKIEQNAKQADPEVRFVRTMQPGEWTRQGDLQITLLDKLPKDLIKTEERQLVSGTTQGSRHVLDAILGKAARIWVRKSPTALQGPIVELKERCHVVHPEHAHHSLPSGIYEITYQRDRESEEIARVRD